MPEYIQYTCLLCGRGDERPDAPNCGRGQACGYVTARWRRLPEDERFYRYSAEEIAAREAAAAEWRRNYQPPPPPPDYRLAWALFWPLAAGIAFFLGGVFFGNRDVNVQMGLGAPVFLSGFYCVWKTAEAWWRVFWGRPG